MSRSRSWGAHLLRGNLARERVRRVLPGAVEIGIAARFLAPGRHKSILSAPEPPRARGGENSLEIDKDHQARAGRGERGEKS